MARTLFRLTDRIIRNFEKPGYHADGGGLYLQVAKSGSKSWVYRFTLKGRTRDMGLGSIRSVTLAEARTAAAESRLLVAKGVDPIAGRAEPEFDPPQIVAPPTGPTFREFAEQYIEQHTGDWRSKQHEAQWSSSLKMHVFPLIGDLQLDAIDTPEVLLVLEPIWREKSETASRIRGRIERILAAAAVRGLRPATNPAAWAGHLREALPKKRRSTPFSALNYRELPAFMSALRAREGVGARALEFTILTVARSGQARGARWPEIDEAAEVWSVPGERMKAGRQHLVPLSGPTLFLLREMKPLRDLAGGFLFPGMRNGGALSDMTLSHIVRSMGYDATVHGFRAGFKTWAEEETHHANVVIEAALAHTVGDKAERAYMRGDWLVKRKALLDDWGAFCNSTPIETVVPLDVAAA